MRADSWPDTTSHSGSDRHKVRRLVRAFDFRRLDGSGRHRAFHPHLSPADGRHAAQRRADQRPARRATCSTWSRGWSLLAEACASCSASTQPAGAGGVHARVAQRLLLGYAARGLDLAARLTSARRRCSATCSCAWPISTATAPCSPCAPSRARWAAPTRRPPQPRPREPDHETSRSCRPGRLRRLDAGQWHQPLLLACSIPSRSATSPLAIQLMAALVQHNRLYDVWP